MTPTERPATRRLPRSSRREQLLDVTKAIVGSDGFHAISIDRVAREAGVSRPIIYEHFNDLAGLLRALLDREGARALEQLSQFMPAEPASGPLIERLLSALAAYLEAVQTDPVTWRLMLMPPEGAPDFLRARVDQTRAGVVAHLARMLETTVAREGGAESPDPLLTASSIQAIADHWARLILSEPERFDRDRILVTARWALARFA